jgi:hypothetical protein
MRKASRQASGCALTLLILYSLSKLSFLRPEAELLTGSPSQSHQSDDYQPPAATFNEGNRTWKCPPEPLNIPGLFFYPALSIASRFEINRRKATPPCRPPTPLFIAFASKFCLLQQALLSYIAEGWPPSQIVVVDNTGSWWANLHERLTQDNHTFLNHTLLRQTYGVNIYAMPTRLSFAQLQNTLLTLARTSGWPDFYSSHQDIVIRSSIVKVGMPFYHSVLQERELHSPVPATDSTWAITFFHYDWLARTNVHAATQVGSWDVLIPWYPTDCDYYRRTRLRGYSIVDHYAGEIFDLATCLPDPETKLFLPTDAAQNANVTETLRQMGISKGEHKQGRNIWQGRERGGIADDFGPRFTELVQAGRENYRAKWGTSRCDVSLPDQSWYGTLKTALGNLLGL